ncbi:MAG TPA: DUF4388 domain-containing protein [Syntrophorhabdaceae bacterium]|nr:DUF4388 domain-containing protein [Syntrophorhabdaceae bacterium]
MSNDFVGDLSKKRLFELIKPLLDENSSGMLAIKGDNAGELYIEEGSIVHGKTGSFSGEEAILAMMEWDTGFASFDRQAAMEEQTVYMPTEQLLAIWRSRENEWERIRELIPSSNTVYRLSLGDGSEEKHIKAIQWSILALCDGTRAVSEVAAGLKLHIFETSQIMYKMVQDGLLEKASEKDMAETVKTRPTVQGDFFVVFQTELTRIIGPLAPIIIDEALEDFGESKDAFPQDRLHLFVESVGGQIADTSKRTSFVRLVMEPFVEELK